MTFHNHCWPSSSNGCCFFMKCLGIREALGVRRLPVLFISCLSESSKTIQSAGIRRTYSPSKVIHRWRGVSSFYTPQPTVNNFGRALKMLCEQLPFWLNRKVGHAGPGRRISHSNVATFIWRYSLRALRLVVKEYSEPFARNSKNFAETNLYKCFHPTRPACSR